MIAKSEGHRSPRKDSRTGTYRGAVGSNRSEGRMRPSPRGSPAGVISPKNFFGVALFERHQVESCRTREAQETFIRFKLSEERIQKLCVEQEYPPRTAFGV